MATYTNDEIMENLNNDERVNASEIFNGIDTPLLIVMPHDDVEDQEACERGFMQVISYVRKNYPRLPFTVFTYHPMSFDPEDNERLQTLAKTHQTGVTVTGEEIRVFEFLRNPNLQGRIINFQQ